MALITCPECGKELSDTIPTCPNCGYPIVPPKAKAIGYSTTSTIVNNTSKKKFSPKALVIVCLIIAIGIGVISSIFLKSQDNVVGTWEDRDTLAGSYILVCEFAKDGTFTSSAIELKRNLTVPGGTGKYEIDGKNLNIIMNDGQSRSDEFSIEGDTMTWGIQTFTRAK